MIVVLINLVLSSVVLKFTIYEKHNTYTDHYLSVASKLTFALFTNTALIPLFVNLAKDNWFTPSGLLVDVFYYFLSVSFLSPMI